MLDLTDELAALTRALEERGVPYALCGGLAMAVWGKPRATIDIDLLVPAPDIERGRDVARGLGYTLGTSTMHFAGGRVLIDRMTKIDPDTKDPLRIDFLHVGQATDDAWKSRQQVQWQGGSLWVVSREGLVSLKMLRGSGQDQDDIKALTDPSDD